MTPMASTVPCSVRMPSGAERVTQPSTEMQCGFTLAGADRPNVRRPTPPRGAQPGLSSIVPAFRRLKEWVGGGAKGQCLGCLAAMPAHTPCTVLIAHVMNFPVPAINVNLLSRFL